jgi:very-short-patch-repair endonuclease
MAERWRSTPAIREPDARVRATALADRQVGRVGREQLAWLGIDDSRIDRWLHGGYLYTVHPGVYAVGHRAPSVEADLTAALLYAGPGAALSYATAAWWWGLLEHRPTIIEVSTPRRCKSVDGVRVHARRSRERTWHRNLPVTPTAQTALDLASVFDEDRLREVLAELDFRRLLDLEALRRACGQGRPGSTRLKRALRRHEPRLARTNSRLEIDFVLFCERFRLPLPEINARIHGITVDALYRRQGVVVELDGEPNHGTWAQIKRDRHNELVLRSHGLLVVRYTWDQVTFEPDLVSADLSATLDARP